MSALQSSTKTNVSISISGVLIDCHYFGVVYLYLFKCSSPQPFASQPRTSHLLLADFAPESELADLSLWRQKTEDVWCGSRIVNGLVEWKFSVGPKLPFPLTVFRLVSWELISRRTDGASVTFITITPRTTLHNYTAQQHTTLHMDHSFSANNSSLDTVSDWR